MPEDKETRRRELYGLLGDLPDRRKTVRAEVLSEERREKYVLEKLRLDLNGIEAVPAFFVKPITTKPGQHLPTILYNHAHGGDYKLGKEELLKGNGFLQKPYADELTPRGY